MGQKQENETQRVERQTPNARCYTPGQGMFTEAEKYYQEAITLPLFPAMSDEEQGNVISVFREALQQ